MRGSARAGTRGGRGPRSTVRELFRVLKRCFKKRVLRERDHRCVQNMKLLLLRVMKEDPMVDAIGGLVAWSEVTSEEFCVLCEPGRLGLAHCHRVCRWHGASHETHEAPRASCSLVLLG